jgi:hypothetical protein
MMLVANDFNETRSAGAALAAAGDGLISTASLAHLGDAGGGDGTPRTGAALGSLARDWQSGLETLGGQVEALGTYADLVAAAFQKSA